MARCPVLARALEGPGFTATAIVILSLASERTQRVQHLKRSYSGRFRTQAKTASLRSGDAAARELGAEPRFSVGLLDWGNLTRNLSSIALNERLARRSLQGSCD